MRTVGRAGPGLSFQVMVKTVHIIVRSFPSCVLKAGNTKALRGVYLLLREILRAEKAFGV